MKKLMSRQIAQRLSRMRRILADESVKRDAADGGGELMACSSEGGDVCIVILRGCRILLRSSLTFSKCGIAAQHCIDKQGGKACPVKINNRITIG